ncbi:MAG: phosphoribosylformylglycinamidine synthase, partial [Pseudomonadota bacterium]|nr:phosphoribosylformylglycinamidine synthase [Pseudomonadota bacterium]
VLHGSPALSEFRRRRLLAELRRSIPGISDVQADYVYFVALAHELSTEERAMLEELASSAAPARAKSNGELFLVIPRLGTISPWASKATDIAHVCGLAAVARIERGIAYYLFSKSSLEQDARTCINTLIHDRMTQSVVYDMDAVARLFTQVQPAPVAIIDLGADAHHALMQANRDMGLALSDDEIDYLVKHYAAMGRGPTDVELMMFAQANSEHCRHKIFNANWIIDGDPQHVTFFDMIRNTYCHASGGILSAYRDNAAVIQGAKAYRFWPDSSAQAYVEVEEDTHIVMKVETHNHPTAISPFSGAATGAGGEIRDGAATGIGGKPKAGLHGFSVSNLRIPDFEQPWEQDFGKPQRIASALDIMLEGPIGAAAFNNEFGRPNIAGYFRTFEQRMVSTKDYVIRGYHKPIMLAGGVGNIRSAHVHKKAVPPGTPVVVLGGPAMLIGLGGGAASSMASGESTERLDFASVQRGNPEMQRRCQEVIDRCIAQGGDNPILSIHDVGAGGLSNAIPELLADAGQGGRIELRAVPNDEPGMSPLEIWCNEAQERYVLAIDAARIEDFKWLCERERCPYAIIGYSSKDQQLIVADSYFNNTPVDMPLEVLLGKPPRMVRNAHRRACHRSRFEAVGITIDKAAERVLRLPSVASKNFLITIGDRTVGGLVTRDQMVGPWQVPVADVGVTCADYRGYAGEAIALGERAPIALIDAAASGRMAVGEALTNIAAASIAQLSDVRLSANWMAAAGYPGDDAALFETVHAIGQVLCPALGIAIPVGKDSLAMRTVWEQDSERREVVAPLSVIITAFAPATDVRRTLTPQLRTDCGDTKLILIDLGHDHARLGGSALAQVYNQTGDQVPDLDDPQIMRAFFACIQELNRKGLLLAYHDRSDGGLFTTLCEMAFAGHIGIDVEIDALRHDSTAALFNEELGAVAQVRRTDLEQVLQILQAAGLSPHSHVIGTLTPEDRIVIRHRGEKVFARSRAELHAIWAETSYRMQALRDNPDCAKEEFAAISDTMDPGLAPRINFDLNDDIAAPYIATGIRPRVAILREQGVNGQVEMAAAFHRTGFEAVDVHMSDLIAGRVSLAGFKGLAAGGGFSYGDVLGAGGGWAKSILFNTAVRAQFEQFFARDDTFGLGVCNGCQMLSYLRELIPGSRFWPRFIRNESEQFEARVVMVEILPSPSVLFTKMQGAMLPIAIAHGEGRAEFRGDTATAVLNAGLAPVRYVDNYGAATERYPYNPSGSPHGIAGLTNRDGRFTIMMPHPERVFRTVQNSWHPDEWGEGGPWLRMFRNARAWLG